MFNGIQKKKSVVAFLWYGLLNKLTLALHIFLMMRKTFRLEYLQIICILTYVKKSVSTYPRKKQLFQKSHLSATFPPHKDSKMEFVDL